jgi:hypothetical protein
MHEASFNAVYKNDSFCNKILELFEEMSPAVRWDRTVTFRLKGSSRADLEKTVKDLKQKINQHSEGLKFCEVTYVEKMILT